MDWSINMADEKTKIHKCPSFETIDYDDQANSGNGVKRKHSRKEMRKQFRARKKARIHIHFLSRGTKQTPIDVKNKGLELETSGAKCVEKSKKKKKRKKVKNKQQDSQHESNVRDQLSTKVYKNEDQEMEELEKKLKLNKKAKLPKAFFEEGLNDIIEVCDAIETGSLKLQVRHDQETHDGGIQDDFENDSTTGNESDVENTLTIDDDDDDRGLENKCEHESEVLSEASSKLENEEERDNNDGVDKELMIMDSLPKSQKSSDIYGGASAKYVPPHQRLKSEKEQAQDEQVRERLRKQVKGLLNRLSESNLSMVSGQIERLYMSNSRNDLNEILSSLLMDACISPSLMSEGLLREHIMLITILNSLVGSEVGAFLLQKLAIQFEKLHKCSTTEGKEIHNVVTLFAFLYSFKVIDCILMYDIIRQLVATFREQDVELILLLIRLIGLEIRRESPESLKEIILEVQAKAATDTQLSNTSRTRFMLETVNALRNNNIRKIPNYDPSQTDRARKILKSLIHDTGQNNNAKLSISLSDLLSAEQKGRWWIVGSAWDDRGKKNTSETLDVLEVTDHANIMELARQQRMNTDIRRNIFCIVMTSEDYVDAFEKLMRLKLKDKQSREIVHVLMDCSLQLWELIISQENVRRRQPKVRVFVHKMETSYNPFYSYLIQKLCEFSRSYQVTVQYSFWDRFKMVPELTDHNLCNMAHLLVHLLVTKSLSLSVLKVVDFTSLDKRLLKFFTEMLTHILLDYQESATREVFMRIAPLTKLDTLKESLKLFMKHFMKPKKSNSSREINIVDKQIILEERINVAINALSGS